MTTMMPKRLKCPNCGASVQAHVLMSTNFHGMTTDLRRLTTGADPWQYMVHSCQTCGFTGSEPEFTGNVSREVAALIAERMLPHLRDETVPTDTRWEFAAMIAEWRKADPETIAQMYHNAAWCAASTEREQYFRRRAADWLEQSLEGKVSDRSVVLYLIGEHYRRCGEKAVADTWFDAAIAEAGNDPKQERLKALALQQKANPQDMISS